MKANRKALMHISLLQLILLVFSVLISHLSGRAVLLGFEYFLLQFMCIFIPGFALCLISDIGLKKVSSLITYAYFFGMTIITGEFFVLSLLHLIKFSLIINVIIAILCNYLIFRNIEKIRDISADLFSYISLIFVILIIIIDIYSVTLSNPLPVGYASVGYNKDFMYWIGNSISFIKGIPVQDYRLPGIPFYYHYFSNVFIAQQYFISGISIVDLSFCYSYLVAAILLSYCSFVALDHFVRNRYLLILGMIFILFTEGSTSFLTSHIYFCPFGFDYSYALAMLGIYHLAYMYEEDDYSFKMMAVSCLIIAMCAGNKGPVAIVMLMGFGMVAFDMLINRKWKKGLICGFSWLMAFVVTYLVFITDISGATVTTNDLMFLGPIGAFDNNYWAIDILSELMNEHGLGDGIVTRALSLLLYVFRSNKASMFLLVIAIVIYLYRLFFRKKNDVLLLSLIMICLWGIMLTVNTYQDGNSQMYFIMSCFPFGVLGGLYAMDSLNKSKVFIIISALIILFVSYDDIDRFINERIRNTIDNANNIYNGLDQNRQKGLRITDEDYEMCLWLKENTDELAYIAVDRFEYDEMTKVEGFGVFSERFIWNDGQYAYEVEAARRRAIVDRLFKNDEKAVSELKAEGVSYIIQTISQNPIRLGFGLKEVYRSSAYIIYRLD